MKVQFIVLFICLSGSLLAQNKKEQDELMKQYESKRLVYDSLYAEHEEKLLHFDGLLNAYRQEQNKLTQSYESAFSIKNRAIKKYNELAGINKLPENFSKQQLDTIRLYKLNEFRTPNWNAIRVIESQERIPAINWKEIPKKERGLKLQEAVNELDQANIDFMTRINGIGEQSEDLRALSEELLRFRKLNEERSKVLLSLDWRLDEQRSKYQEYFWEDGIGGFHSSPPPPPPVPQMNNDVIHNFVDEPAEFPGGGAALKKYIADNLVYPEAAKKAGIEGTSYIQFIVSAKGNVSNVKVVRNLPDCPECDKEAVRVVKAMPTWKPGKLNGVAVNSTFNLPVKFRLPVTEEQK